MLSSQISVALIVLFGTWILPFCHSNVPIANQNLEYALQKIINKFSLGNNSQNLPNSVKVWFQSFRNHFSQKCLPVRSIGKTGCQRGWKTENNAENKRCTFPNYDEISPCTASLFGSSRIIDCTLQKISCLETIELPGDVTTLYLDRNDLSNENHLKQTLSYLQKLELIDLSSNNYRRIPFRLFEFNPSLRLVAMERNFITYIPEGAFTSNPRLSRIYFRGNEIKYLPSLLFTSNDNLREVDFRNNKLAEFSGDLFFDNMHLHTVDFSHNLLHHIAEESFLANPNLYEVGLTSNLLSEVPPLLFEHNINLVTLKLSNNQIQNLSHVFLQNCFDLNFLDLSNNRIRSIPYGFLQNNIKLRHLDLKGNRVLSNPGIDGLFVSNPLIANLLQNQNETSKKPLVRFFEQYHWYASSSIENQRFKGDEMQTIRRKVVAKFR